MSEPVERGTPKSVIREHVDKMSTGMLELALTKHARAQRSERGADGELSETELAGKVAELEHRSESQRVVGRYLVITLVILLVFELFRGGYLSSFSASTDGVEITGQQGAP